MRLKIISEAGYGRTYSFDYQNAQTDKRPRMLLLGKWRHPTTRNILLAGLNLNYLTDEQIARVRQNLKAIVQPRNLKSRYHKGTQLVPDVFKDAYRTYDKDYVGSITKDTLKFWPSDEALERADKEAQDAEAKKKEADIKKTAAPAAPGVPGAATPAAPAAAAPSMPGTEPGAVSGAAPEPTEIPKPDVAPAVGKEPAPKPDATKTPRQRRLAKQAKPVEPAPVEPTTAEPAATEPAATTPAAAPAAPAEPVKGALPVEPKPKLTSAQKRKKQAQQIEKAIERTKPQPKPEPPPEIGPSINMFKPGK